MAEQSPIEIGFQLYAEEGGETFGAVRGVVPQTNAVVIYIENAGDFEVPAEAVRRVHDGKVIVDVERLDARLRAAIAHAHDREEPGEAGLRFQPLLDALARRIGAFEPDPEVLRDVKHQVGRSGQRLGFRAKTSRPR